MAKFYDSLFLNLDLSTVQEYPVTGRKGFSNHAMVCAFIVMKCEGLSMISDLVDYLNNNLLIAHYCGFDISRPLPSYWTFDRILKNFDNGLLPICGFLSGGATSRYIYMEYFKNLPGAGERSACDLLHLRDGFEIEMNFDRNVSCFVAVYGFMDNDFFNQAV